VTAQDTRCTLKISFFIINFMNPVVHFEMPYQDKGRMTEFYSKAFGWQAETMSPDMGDYVVMTTSEMDPATRMPKKPGMINGGFYKKNDGSQGLSFVVAVDDIQAAMKNVEAAGGKIVGGMKQPGQPDEIPGVGLFISFTDPEGNRLSLLQPKGM
jgi:predicted enzyme related to lactoylglutathione lyase